MVEGGAEQVTRNLIAWASDTLPAVTVASSPLGAGSRGQGVDVRLVALSPRATPRTDNPQIAIDLDYLITARMDDPFAEQNALAELMIAAIHRGDLEMVSTRGGAEICAALGIPVAAGFVVRTSLLRAFPRKRAPLVRAPLRVEASQLGVIHGTVVGPGDVPIAGAVVSIPGIGREVLTDAAGRFRITGAPLDHGDVKVNVKARGCELNGASVSGQNVVLRLPLEV